MSRFAVAGFSAVLVVISGIVFYFYGMMSQHSPFLSDKIVRIESVPQDASRVEMAAALKETSATHRVNMYHVMPAVGKPSRHFEVVAYVGDPNRHRQVVHAVRGGGFLHGGQVDIREAKLSPDESITGSFEVFGNDADINQLLAQLGAEGFETSAEGGLSTAVVFVLFRASNLYLSLLVLVGVMVLLVGYVCRRSALRCAVEALHGSTAAAIFWRNIAAMAGIMMACSGAILALWAVFLSFYNQGYWLSNVIVAASICLIAVTVGALGVFSVCLVSVTKKQPAMVLSRVDPGRGEQLFLRTIRVASLIVCVMAAVDLVGTSRMLAAEAAEQSHWQQAENLYSMTTSAELDPQMRDQLEPRFVSVIEEQAAEGHILLAASADVESSFGPQLEDDDISDFYYSSGNVLVVNQKYLDLNPMVDSQGMPISSSAERLTVLVHERDAARAAEAAHEAEDSLKPWFTDEATFMARPADVRVVPDDTEFSTYEAEGFRKRQLAASHSLIILPSLHHTYSRTLLSMASMRQLFTADPQGFWNALEEVNAAALILSLDNAGRVRERVMNDRKVGIFSQFVNLVVALGVSGLGLMVLSMSYCRRHIERLFVQKTHGYSGWSRHARWLSIDMMAMVLIAAAALATGVLFDRVYAFAMFVVLVFLAAVTVFVLSFVERRVILDASR